MPRQTQARLKQAFEAPRPNTAAAGELVFLADAPKYKTAEDAANKHGFTGLHRDQFIKQSVMLAKHLEAAAMRKKPPVTQPLFSNWQPMGQQQQAGGLLFKK